MLQIADQNTVFSTWPLEEIENVIDQIPITKCIEKHGISIMPFMYLDLKDPLKLTLGLMGILSGCCLRMPQKIQNLWNIFLALHGISMCVKMFKCSVNIPSTDNSTSRLQVITQPSRYIITQQWNLPTHTNYMHAPHTHTHTHTHT